VIVGLPSSEDATVDAAIPPDASEPHDAAEEAVPDAAPDGPTFNPCATPATVLDEWTFDTDAGTGSWGFAFDTGVQVSLTWDSTVGYPSAGALAFDVTPRPNDAGSDDGGDGGPTTSGAWLENAMSNGSLSGRTFAAWVRLESGPSPQFKTFAQSGSQYIWADNGTIDLEPQTWTCVSLPFSSPSYNQGGDFDPTDVIRMGFQMIATEPFRIDFDTIVVY
jgi:hypothetical protein